MKHAGHAPDCNLNTPSAHLGCDCTGDFRTPPPSVEELLKSGAARVPNANPFADLVSTSPPTVAVVKDFTGANIRAIPDRLRTLADTVELDNLENAGPASAIVVMVCAGGRIDVRAFGVCHDKLHAAGILTAGIKELTE